MNPSDVVVQVGVSRSISGPAHHTNNASGLPPLMTVDDSIDLGDAALVVPGGTVVARQELRRVLRDRSEVGLTSIDDPEVADQQH